MVSGPGRGEQRWKAAVASDRWVNARSRIPDRSTPLTKVIDGKRLFLEDNLSGRSPGKSIWHESEVDLGVNARVSRSTRNHETTHHCTIVKDGWTRGGGFGGLSLGPPVVLTG